MACYRKKASTDKIPPAVLLGLRYGKSGYAMDPSWVSGEPSQECLDAFLVCGGIINSLDYGRELWQRYRADLLKRTNVRSWWTYEQFEVKAKSKHVDNAGKTKALPECAEGGGQLA